MPTRLRVEILIPLTYNDGKPIEPTTIFDIKSKLMGKFGGFSTDEATINGSWIDPKDGQAYYDRCKKMVVDVEDSESNRQWLRDYKGELKKTLQQKEIYLVSYKVEQL